MAAERENGAASDNEEQEKPVREQLKKASTSKAGLEQRATISTEPSMETEQPVETDDKVESTKSRGRLQRKRSFEEVEEEQKPESRSESTRQHTRKRSRDSTVEEDGFSIAKRTSSEKTRDAGESETHITANGKTKLPPAQRSRTPEQTGEKRSEDAVEAMASPKTKRSRLHGASGENGMVADEYVPSQPLDLPSNPSTAKVKDSTADSTAEQQPTDKLPATSDFANTSAASPFASLSGTKSPPADPPQTSSSAFTSSGFGSLSGSASTSGFGAIGKSSGGFGAGGGFGSGSKSPAPGATTTTESEESKPASSSAFGGSLGQKSVFATSSAPSAFAAGSSSGLGTLGSGSPFGGTGFGGFGAGGGGSGLSSFASGKPTSSLASSSKPSRTFGAPVDDDDGGEDAGDEPEESGIKSPLSQESDKQDDRFYYQERETGEEDEVTEYSCRAKLYNFAAVAEGKKEWKERGLGVVRLNVSKADDDDEDSKPRARLLMRAEGSHRVILNTPVKKEITFGAPSGGAPSGGYVYFMGGVDGKQELELLQLKVRQQFAQELYDKVVDLQEAM